MGGNGPQGDDAISDKRPHYYSPLKSLLCLSVNGIHFWGFCFWFVEFLATAACFMVAIAYLSDGLILDRMDYGEMNFRKIGIGLLGSLGTCIGLYFFVNAVYAFLYH